jgi:hypothetical protein
MEVLKRLTTYLFILHFLNFQTASLGVRDLNTRLVESVLIFMSLMELLIRIA